MCGIAGIVAPQLSGRELDDAVQRMNGALVHRGPDDEGAFVCPPLHTAIANRRLSIVGLADGRQPIGNEDGSIQVVFNGEIYNHRELRSRLERQGHRLRTSTDTEVLPHLYEQYGDDFLTELNGMFAIALLDLPRRRLLLARDGPGMKPLYYLDADGMFLFASEVRALRASGKMSAEPDWTGVDRYLVAGYTPAPFTIYRGVRKLRAGERLVLEGLGAASAQRPFRTLRRELFWRLAYTPPNGRLREAALAEELEQRLRGAVERHLAADVPVGAFLSGGWDSSLVARLAAEYAPGRLKTFSAVFPDQPGTDESVHSRRMAQALGSDHEEVEFRSSTAAGLLVGSCRHLEEPITGPALIEYQLAQAARRKVKAVLTGQGSDEILGGYAWLQRSRDYLLVTAVPRWLGRLAARILNSYGERYYVRLLGASSEADADMEWFRAVTRPERDRLLRGSLDPNRDELAAHRLDPETLRSCRDRLQRRMALDFTRRLADSIVFHGDKMTMAHSLEARLPFLDRSVVDFATALPSRMKVRGRQEKYLLSMLARKYLPPEIAARRKVGLHVPVHDLLSGPLRDFARETLLDSCGPRGLFRKEALEPILTNWRHQSGYWRRKVWALLVLHLCWSEFWADSSGGAGAC